MRERRHTFLAMATVSVAAWFALAGPVAAQATPVTSADFNAAAGAEVRNAQGQVVLQGRFVVNDEDDDDVERKATLAPTSVDADAAGEAEVEIDKTGSPRRQEVEFELTNLQAGAAYSLLIDGKLVATVNADNRGRASVERDVPLSGTNP